jgi:hypothetical protein
MKGLINVSETRYARYEVALEEDSKRFFDQYFDDFIDEIKEGNSDFSSFVNDYGKIHEFIDQYISLKEAVDIIENCDEEETDSGLWEGLKPKEAIISMAFWSYKNDVYWEVNKLFKKGLEDILYNIENEWEKLTDEFEEMKEDENSHISEEGVRLLKDQIVKLEGFICELNSAIDSL